MRLASTTGTIKKKAVTTKANRRPISEPQEIWVSTISCLGTVTSASLDQEEGALRDLVPNEETRGRAYDTSGRRSRGNQFASPFAGEAFLKPWEFLIAPRC